MTNEAGKVRRFDAHYEYYSDIIQFKGLEESPAGDYILYTDYEASERRVRGLEAAITEFRKAFVVAVGDASPFAKIALERIDAALAAAGDSSHG